MFRCLLHFFLNCMCLAVPTAPPQEVKVINITTDSVQLQWKPPPQREQNGHIRGYKVNGRILFITLPSPARSLVCSILTAVPRVILRNFRVILGNLRMFSGYFGNYQKLNENKKENRICFFDNCKRN